MRFWNWIRALWHRLFPPRPRSLPEVLPETLPAPDPVGPKPKPKAPLAWGMTFEELIEQCDACEARGIPLRVEIAGPPPKSGRARVMPGVLGAVCGLTPDGNHVVAVRVADVRRWLRSTGKLR